MIDKKKYKLEETNYHKETYDKKQIIIGHSYRDDMLHYSSWVNRWNGKYTKTTTYTINLDGNIYEHYDPKYWSDYLGVNQDKFNISITLSNIGWLKKDLNNDYKDWLGHIYKGSDIIIKKWRNHQYWKNYTKEQLKSLSILIKKLCKDFNINKEVIEHNVYDDSIDLFDGIVFKSNYYQEITDVSPAFDISHIKKIENYG